MAVSPGTEVTKVTLLGVSTSSYTQRVQLALKLKGVAFEYVEADLSNKSEELLRRNPVHKKVPVLVHGEDAVAESAVILEYVDETWRHNPIMPDDPLERAKLRFWSRFADEQLGPAVGEVFRLSGEEQKAAVDRVHLNLKLLDDELQDGSFRGRRFFGGETIGLLDIVIGCGSYWLRLLEDIAGVNLVDAATFPRFRSWLRDFEEQEEVKEFIPPADKQLEYAKGLQQMIAMPQAQQTK